MAGCPFRTGIGEWGMAKDDAVSRANEDEGGGWTYACPRFPLCEFTSRGWQTKGDASERGAEHEAEHNGERVMSELGSFRDGRG